MIGNRTIAITVLLALSACGPEEITDPDPVDVQLTYLEPNDPAGVVLPDPATFDYYIGAQFTTDGVLGSLGGETYAQDSQIICTTGCEDNVRVDNGVTLYPVDNAFGYDVRDFANSTPRDRDGVHEEAWVGTIVDGVGDPMGLAVSNPETSAFRVPSNMGSWCTGLQPDPVKCSTEHYVVMEHLKTCAETIPYWYSDPDTGVAYPEFSACDYLSDVLDQPIADLVPDENDLGEIAVGLDYGVSLKDDGKVLYRFGDLVKKPTDMRILLQMPLPTEWATGEWTVTKAELAVVHTITNSPNDQIRPEDWENEGAVGRKPSYEVASNGQWLSTVDCYEGDGKFIPAGTVLRNPTYGDSTEVSSDLRDGYTNSWYRTLDRDPFAWDTINGTSPRWRFKAPKMGQDLPGFEIPLANCLPPPIQHGEEKYEVGALTTTHIDLLDFGAAESPMASSLGWIYPAGQPIAEGNLTETGILLSDQFDLAVYVKGEQKSIELYSAHLYIDYEAAAQ